MKTYFSYMLEHVNDIISNEREYGFGDIDMAYVEAAESAAHVTLQMNKTYYLKEHLQPLISKAMTKKGIDSVIEFTGNFIDDHSRELMVGSPIYNFTFDVKETAFLYKIIGITEAELRAMYDEAVKVAYTGTYVDKASPVILIRTVPHMLLIIGMLVWAIENNEEDLKEAIRYLIIFVWYPMVYRPLFPHGVNEAMMEYTVEHSGKRFIRQHKTMLSYLHYHGVVCYNNFEERLKNPTDVVYADFNNRIRNQLNSALKGIASIYYANHQNNATHQITSDTFADGNLSDQDSTTSKIGQLSDNTFAKFNTTVIDITVANAAAEGSGVSKAKLVSYLNKLIPMKENELFKMIENIIILYVASKPDDDSIGSGTFLNFGLSLYRSISFSKEASRVIIDRLLTKWTNELLDITSEYPTRPATVIGFRKALYYYVIFMIQRYNA